MDKFLIKNEMFQSASREKQMSREANKREELRGFIDVPEVFLTP